MSKYSNLVAQQLQNKLNADASSAEAERLALERERLRAQVLQQGLQQMIGGGTQALQIGGNALNQLVAQDQANKANALQKARQQLRAAALAESGKLKAKPTEQQAAEYNIKESIREVGRKDPLVPNDRVPKAEIPKAGLDLAFEKLRASPDFRNLSDAEIKAALVAQAQTDQQQALNDRWKEAQIKDLEGKGLLTQSRLKVQEKEAQAKIAKAQADLAAAKTKAEIDQAELDLKRAKSARENIDLRKVAAARFFRELKNKGATQEQAVSGVQQALGFADAQDTLTAVLNGEQLLREKETETESTKAKTAKARAEEDKIRKEIELMGKPQLKELSEGVILNLSDATAVRQKLKDNWDYYASNREKIDFNLVLAYMDEIGKVVQGSDGSLIGVSLNPQNLAEALSNIDKRMKGDAVSLEFARRLKDTALQQMYARAGKQLSDSEIRQNMAIFGKPYGSRAEFEAAYTDNFANFDRDLKRKATFLKMSKRDMAPEIFSEIMEFEAPGRVLPQNFDGLAGQVKEDTMGALKTGARVIGVPEETVDAVKELVGRKQPTDEEGNPVETKPSPMSKSLDVAKDNLKRIVGMEPKEPAKPKPQPFILRKGAAKVRIDPANPKDVETMNRLIREGWTK